MPYTTFTNLYHVYFLQLVSLAFMNERAPQCHIEWEVFLTMDPPREIFYDVKYFFSLGFNVNCFEKHLFCK